MTSTKSEATIQSEIMLEVSRAGHSVWRSNAGSVQDKRGFVVKLFPKGFTDLIGHRGIDGKAFYIEVKNAKGIMSEDQKRFAKFAAKQPVIYGVARSPEDALHIIDNSLNGYGVK